MHIAKGTTIQDKYLNGNLKMPQLVRQPHVLKTLFLISARVVAFIRPSSADPSITPKGCAQGAQGNKLSHARLKTITFEA